MVQPKNGTRRTCLTMRTRWLVWGVAVLSLATIGGCVQEVSEEPETVGITHRIFSAEFVNEAPETRLQIDNEGNMQWNPGDEIAVFHQGVDGVYPFTATCTEVSEKTDFEGDLGTGTGEVYAVFPASSATDLGDDDAFVNNTLVLKDVQTSFTDGQLMVARTDNGSDLFRFFNICSGLKLTVQDTGIVSVDLRGNDGEDLAGTFTYELNAGGPVVTGIQEGKKVVSYATDAENGFTPGEWLYLKVLPKTFEQGITVTFHYKSGKQRVVVLNNRLTFKRNTWKKAANLDEKSEPNMQAVPLTFEILSAGKITWHRQNENYTRVISYSVDGGETWTSLGANRSITVEPGDYVQFKGNNPAYCSHETGGGSSSLPYNYFQGMNFSTTVEYNVFGNIVSLIDDNQLTTTELSKPTAFYMLFKDNTGLKSAKDLVLPENTTRECYGQMFYGCSSLEDAPDLPATVLSSSCYSSMFYGCSSLKAAAKMNVLSVDMSSCNKMYSGCSSLTELPISLSATELKAYCYEGMFEGCSSLVNAPELPATTLANSCYKEMFSGCVMLEQTPVLPVLSLTYSCYEAMFKNCKNLQTAPALPATALGNTCYKEMFYGCTGLEEAPALPATTLKSDCYRSMFENCTKITRGPDLLAETLVSGCYYTMFQGCTSLNYVKCMATSGDSNATVYNWLKNVAGTGELVVAKRWSSNVPTGWLMTIVTE